MPSWLPPALVFLFVAIVLVAGHMLQFQTLSIIDENAHFDYIERLPDPPNTGDRLTQETMRVTACRGYPESFDYDFQPCSTDVFDPNTFPGQGYSTAGFGPPAYYALTAVVAHPVSWLTGRDLFTSARAVGALWLTLLMMSIWAIASALGARMSAAMGAALLIGSSSDVVSSAATVGPDVATATIGAAVILAALRFEGGRRNLVLLLALVVLAALTKLTVFTAVGAALVSLVAHPLIARRPVRPTVARRAGVAALLLMVFGAVAYLWTRRPLAPGLDSASDIPINQMFAVDSIPWPDVLNGVTLAFLNPIAGNFNAPYLEGPLNSRLEVVVAGILLFGVLSGLLALGQRPRTSALALGLVLPMLAGPILLVLLNFYVNGMYFGLPHRYGIALVPGMAAVAAAMLSTVGLSRALALLGTVSVLVAMV